jgi:thiol:disulfide interchange protein
MSSPWPRAARILLGAFVLLFAALPARAELPDDLRGDWFGESQYAVERFLYADRTQVRPGEEFTLAVQFSPFHRGEDVKFHIYSNVESPDGAYIPSTLEIINAEAPQKSVLTSEVWPAGNNGEVDWDAPAWPTGVDHNGQLWLEGQPVVLIHGRLRPDAEPGPKKFYAVTTFTSCTTEMCLSPSEVLLEWEVEAIPADSTAAPPVLTAQQLYEAKPYTEDDFSLPPDFVHPDATKSSVLKPEGGGKLNLSNIQSKPGGTQGLSLWQILLGALLGGLILNFMPCVLPVVSIKVISLVRQVEDHPKTVLAHGLAFSGGIIFMFFVLAVVIAMVQASGTQLGWGAQFQSAEFNLAMATLIFVFGLSLAGVFTIKPPKALTEAGEHLAEKEGLTGSFFKGALATILGTPCVGPLLGPALSVAFQRTWFETLWIFLVVGAGMALPYLLMLPFIMRMGRRERGVMSRHLQESRHWLVDFERVMAFLMFGTAVYLLNILYGVLGGEAIIWTLGFFTIVGFAAWLWGRMVSGGPRYVPAAVVSVLTALVIGAWLTLSQITAFAMYFGRTPEAMPQATGPNGLAITPAPLTQPVPGTTAVDPSQPILSGKHLGWEEFNLDRLQYLTDKGQTVLVDFTADWCPNCKTNELVALNIDSTRKLREELGITFMVADWTKKDKAIGTTLRQLGYVSIPLTAIFPGSNPNSPLLLEGVFGASLLHQRMREAAEEGAAPPTSGD